MNRIVFGPVRNSDFVNSFFRQKYSPRLKTSDLTEGFRYELFQAAALQGTVNRNRVLTPYPIVVVGIAPPQSRTLFIF